MTELVKIQHTKTTHYARPKMAAVKPENPDHPQWKRRRRRNSTLMYLGIAMLAATTAGGFIGKSNDVLVNALYVGLLLAVSGAGLYTWTALDRMKIGK